MKCKCGNSFGNISGRSPKCTRCGLSQSKKVGIFSDSNVLSEAVARANLPKELSRDVAQRISEKKHKAQPSNESDSSPASLIRAMKNATDENGVLTIKSVRIELSSLLIDDPTAEHLIGQAEIEGILVRSSLEEWVWLQQSS